MPYFKFKPVVELDIYDSPERWDQLIAHYGGKLMIPTREVHRMQWFAAHEHGITQSYNTKEDLDELRKSMEDQWEYNQESMNR